jgi:Zn-dependent peptidase ImmA (M78 family)
MVRPLNPSGVLDPVEAAAARVRAAAGLEPDALVADVVVALRHAGLVVAVRDLGADGLDGIYVSEERGGGVVVLNTAKFPYRVRRVAAHLLAHHVYGDEPHLDRDIDAPPGDPVQARANAFAARFLVSAEALRARCRAGVTPARALQLTAEFGVGYRLLAGRLHDLARVDSISGPRQNGPTMGQILGWLR